MGIEWFRERVDCNVTSCKVYVHQADMPDKGSLQLRYLIRMEPGKPNTDLVHIWIAAMIDLENDSWPNDVPSKGHDILQYAISQDPNSSSIDWEDLTADAQE